MKEHTEKCFSSLLSHNCISPTEKNGKKRKHFYQSIFPVSITIYAICVTVRVYHILPFLSIKQKTAGEKSLAVFISTLARRHFTYRRYTSRTLCTSQIRYGFTSRCCDLRSQHHIIFQVLSVRRAVPPDWSATPIFYRRYPPAIYAGM